MSNLTSNSHIMATVQSFCEAMGIKAPVSNIKQASWSKPQNVKVITGDFLQSIREVWIDTLSGTSESGEAYSHRYVFINFDGNVIKILADKVMDKFQDKTCLDPSKVYVFERVFLNDSSKVITRCAGQPNGKMHQWDVQSIM